MTFNFLLLGLKVNEIIQIWRPSLRLLEVFIKVQFYWTVCKYLVHEYTPHRTSSEMNIPIIIYGLIREQMCTLPYFGGFYCFKKYSKMFKIQKICFG